MKKGIVLFLATVLCMTFLTACGDKEVSGNVENNVGTEGSSASDGSQAADDSQASAQVQTVKEGVLTIGTNAAFPPFEYIGDDGEPTGFDIALGKAIGEKLGLQVEIQDMEFNALVAAVGSKIDIAIAGMTIEEDRKEFVDFSDPYYDAVQYVIALSDAVPETVADLENKNIGVQLGTTGQTTAEGIAGATVNPYDKAVDAVNDLINGRVDFVIIDKNPAEVFVSNFEGKIVAVDGAQFDFVPEDYAIALSKGSDMVEQVNAALEELKADGTFDALVKEYIVAE